MKLGDLVVRKSYGGDIVFRVEQLLQHTATLKGTDYRLLADAPLADLAPADDPQHSTAAMQASIKVHRSIQKLYGQPQGGSEFAVPGVGVQHSTPYFNVPGGVLHLDGDGNYMRKSMQLYGQTGVPAHGLHIQESMMADTLQRLLPQLRPDIVVITGHDGVIKTRMPHGDLNSLASYKNSRHFVNAVHVARNYERAKDGLVVIAGACQSHFEALLYAGANFASSPGRILIHALDPVYVAIKASYTPFRETISLAEIVQGTISGPEGMGGIETMGKLRMGLPMPKEAHTLQVQPQF